MAKRYARLNWQNNPSVATPLNSTNLNVMDKGIDDMDNAIEDLYSVKIDKTSIVHTDTVNDTTKVPSSAVTYAQSAQISSLANSVDAINNNLVEEVIAVTFVSGVTGICLKNKATGLVKLSVTINSPLSNPTLITTLPIGARPATTQIFKGVAKQASGFGRCNLSIDTGGFVQLAAIDYNEPMNDLTFNLCYL